MPGLAQDLRYSFRLLRRAPLFATAAIATLPVAIGSTTSLLSVVDAVFRSPLHWAGEERFVRLRDFQRTADGRRELWNTSGTSFEAIRAGNRVFDRLVAFRAGSRALSGTGGAPPERAANRMTDSRRGNRS